jgi:glycosyltransferase involved in cell wall biosynthesis
MNKNIPLVSIVCTTYNQELYIKDALESFIMQRTNFPFEIIVHDDASTNVVTKDFLYMEYRNKHISKLFLQNGKNRGIARAVHTCFQMAEGEFIYKLDTDLIYRANWLSVTPLFFPYVVPRLGKRIDCTVAGCGKYQECG